MEFDDGFGVSDGALRADADADLCEHCQEDADDCRCAGGLGPTALAAVIDAWWKSTGYVSPEFDREFIPDLKRRLEHWLYDEPASASEPEPQAKPS
ncbi:MAG TPA: hypothetical protein VEA38_08505 [Terriglobales bacterium]|nr:hypothetical protein [Terriglobales bacterium]